MEALILSSVLAALALAWAVPRWRLRRATARPLDAAAIAVLERNVEQYRGMDAGQRARLERLVRRFLHEKTFVGCAGLEITDEMRLTIAGQACLLLLGNRGDTVYASLHSVLVYPGAFPGAAAPGRCRRRRERAAPGLAGRVLGRRPRDPVPEPRAPA
ncbi:zinc-dependent peptidase [Massilia sp. Dwa41.01b]|uniref:zinc-dependent peptidase n=1 Tax=Massilia sp. Dwa41.01b TaxID=2709302 RepID=UPI002803EC0B|nr:zinc-dependent peptidase [Massilia sp. Dwa41.01b]